MLKMVKNKDMQFFMENLKRKRKKDKNFLTFRCGDLNPRFSVTFPPLIWIFMWSEEPEIKSKQASKRDMTLRIFIVPKTFILTLFGIWFLLLDLFFIFWGGSWVLFKSKHFRLHFHRRGLGSNCNRIWPGHKVINPKYF